MSKNKSFLLLFIFSFLIFIIADFFPGVPWYIQIGPMILTVIIIFLAALFEKKEDEPKETETADDRKKHRKYWIAFIIFIWLVIIGMNIFVGEPEGNVFNIGNLEFWILIVVLPLLAQFNYKKRTDGV